MNPKTTLFLLAAFVGLAAGFWLLRPQKSDSAEQPAPSPFAELADATDRYTLVEEEIGDPVKVVIRRADADADWVFVKGSADEGETSDARAGTPGPPDQWRMTAPIETKVASWEMDKFDRQLLEAEYELSYQLDAEGGVTLAEAGLDPPQATVTMTDADGRSVTVEIGLPVSQTASYARLAGADSACVLDLQLEHLVKKKALDYRDMQVWDIPTDTVVALEIIDRSDPQDPTTYAFKKADGKWMIESPVAARATNKIGELVRAVIRLRATRWDDADASRFGMYGLATPVRTVRITSEQKIESDDEADGDDADEGAPVVPATERVVHEFHLSDQSPIGEDTKVFFRFDDSPVVGRIARTTADKFVPALDQWREMKLTPAPVKTASRIEIDTPDGAAALFKSGAAWQFEDDDALAERAAVAELLDAVAGLEATAFVDAPADLAEYGLDEPRATVALTVPSLPEPERFAVGGYTDPNLRRLVYVRRNEHTAIAKVPAKRVEPLLRAPRAYRDRTIFNLPAAQINEVTVIRMNDLVPGQLFLTYKKDEDGWRMMAPEDAPVRESEMESFVTALARLKGKAIAGDASEAEQFGLDRPAATVYLATQEPERTTELAVAKHDDKWYAQSPQSAVFEIDSSFADRVLAEYRTDEVLDFDDQAVLSFSIRESERTHTFEKRDDQWVYAAEPDWPLDQKKVDALLLQIKDLRTRHYVAYQVDALQPFGLAAPLREVTVTLDGGVEQQLLISGQTCENDPDGGVYAMRAGTESVFLLTPDMVSRLDVALDALEAGG